MYIQYVTRRGSIGTWAELPDESDIFRDVCMYLCVLSDDEQRMWSDISSNLCVCKHLRIIFKSLFVSQAVLLDRALKV